METANIRLNTHPRSSRFEGRPGDSPSAFCGAPQPTSSHIPCLSGKRDSLVLFLRKGFYQKVSLVRFQYLYEGSAFEGVLSFRTLCNFLRRCRKFSDGRCTCKRFVHVDLAGTMLGHRRWTVYFWCCLTCCVVCCWTYRIRSICTAAKTPYANTTLVHANCARQASTTQARAQCEHTDLQLHES